MLQQLNLSFFSTVIGSSSLLHAWFSTLSLCPSVGIAAKERIVKLRMLYGVKLQKKLELYLLSRLRLRCMMKAESLTSAKECRLARIADILVRFLNIRIFQSAEQFTCTLRRNFVIYEFQVMEGFAAERRRPLGQNPRYQSMTSTLYHFLRIPLSLDIKPNLLPFPQHTHVLFLRSIRKNTIGPLVCCPTGSSRMHLSWCESRYGFMASESVLSRDNPN